MTPYFFGYGSLVNTDTHVYEDSHRAVLRGWRRAWVRTSDRDMAFLTARADPGSAIDGLIAAVPGADWVALDARERGYERLHSQGAVEHPLHPDTPVQHYAIPEHTQVQHAEPMILLSYLDVVIQGFLRQYGEAGVQRFIDTTDGWDTPILNDRDAPRYPRAKVLLAEETALVDDHLKRLSALVK